ncbi:hypothetical protein LOTGIDRAFT_175657 [Lottia gigantea]|uniref:Uncharacterized protein n=1 Tax=Lottia gigantea TaxID=225164 RepID=V4BUF7_LOTGI|nr:hypothetical protein LOTGIDRAFT_175657 [Lottia gigantea]ESO92704.1 hypothetical protein LOTGIDRAFT_175657 [Lottia gigantea]
MMMESSINSATILPPYEEEFETVDNLHWSPETANSIYLFLIHQLQASTLTSFNGISLHVKKENEEPGICYKDTIYTKYSVNNIECSQVITGRYITISNFHPHPHAKYLVFCEVEIYDRNCSVETSLCNHISGSCIGGCKEGFGGIVCVKRCEDGVYGAGCRKKCSDRKCKDSNLQCESKTGECIDGCQIGYQSIDCTQENADKIIIAACVSVCVLLIIILVVLVVMIIR